jgi:streptogramin lyase
MKGTVAILALVASLAGCSGAAAPRGAATSVGATASAAQPAATPTVLQQSSELPLTARQITVVPPQPGWEMGMVSWVAADRNGLVYLIQRGDKADPVVVVGADGRVVRSWGKGMYTTPHAIRIDPDGNVWTTDAKTSMVYKFSPDGRKLLEISVGGQPADCTGGFCGTTDVAFGPNGRVFIADGYRNARILEYSADGRKVREWGAPGTGPGQFRLVHSIAIDETGTIYVGDRENARTQRFDLNGKYLGEWPYGRNFSIALQPGTDNVWLATIPAGLSNGNPGHLIKVDRRTGRIIGYVPTSGTHGVHAFANGEVMSATGPWKYTPQR